MRILKTILFLFVVVNSASSQVDTTAILQGNDEELMFGCYPSSDTLEYLIAYFPEQKEFFINNTLCTKEDLCKTIRHSIESNKGVMHYYAPESNFMFMVSIVREIEKCYKNKIDELSEKKFGANYEDLSPDQKTIIDSQLTYRMESK